MPSPIGHALGAFVCGWIAAGPAPTADTRAVAEDGAAGSRPTGSPSLHDWLASRLCGPIPPASVPRALAFAGLGLVADFDLFVGHHSAYTHSIGAAGIVFLAAVVLLGPARWMPAAGAAAAYFSHPALDWLGEDTSVPLGVMLWWPFSTSYYHSGLDFFGSVDRRYWLPGFLAHNLASIAREFALLVPAAAAALFVRRPGNEVATPQTGRSDKPPERGNRN